MNTLDTFISGLYATGSHVKTSGLDGFGVAELGTLYGTPASHLEAAEKLAHDAACFLSQFDGTPLHAQAIALIGEELRLEAERIQRDEARRAQQEPMEDGWTKQRMIDLKKRQLELELHKSRAGEGEGQEQEVPAAMVQAPQTTGAAPAKTASAKLSAVLAARTRCGSKTSGLKLASPPGVARGLLAGAKKPEAWRNAAQYMSPADLLGKAVQSAKTQSGGMSRSVADYVKKTAALRAARGIGR